MSLSVLAIIVVSTFMHAGWNLMVRHGRSEPLFIRRMLIAGTVLGLGPVLIWEVLDPLGPRVWMLVCGSGTCCAIYFAGLAKAYSASDFTIVYPVARALPVLLVGVADVFLDRWPTPLGWMGMALVVVGCMLTPLTTLRSFHVRAYWNRASLWIGLAALATVGYSLVDKVGAEVLRETFSAGPVAPMRYGVIFFSIATIVYELFIRLAGVPLTSSPPAGWTLPALAAVLNTVSYGLIVWALQLTEQVSYVVAFRQFSIVIGVVAAMIIFREPGRTVRFIAALVITAGLVVIGVWGQ